VNYRPTGDSPFDCAYRDWLSAGHIGFLSELMRDELASCASAKLSCPIYENDSDLNEFRHYLRMAA
jgi:hypothetical protein